jgi:hypothetical protein
MGLVVTPLIAAAPAWAQAERAVVLDFEGRGGTVVRRSVVSALSEEVDLAKRSEAEAAASEAGVDLDTPAGRSAVAEALGVDVLIAGRVRGRGARARIDIVVYGRDGQELASGRGPPPLGRRGRRALEAKARGLVKEALAQQPEPEPLDPEPTPYEKEEPPPVEVPPEPGEAEEAAQPRSSWPVPAVTLLVGAGAGVHRTEVPLESGERRLYDWTAFPELAFAVEARPLASSASAARGLLLRGSAALSVGLSSTDQSTSDEVDTTAFRVGAELGYLYGFAEGRVEVGLAGGFAYEAFVLGDNSVLPTSRYAQLRVGAISRIGLVPERLTLGVELGLRAAFTAGDLGTAFGDEVSPLGLDAALSVGGALDVGFAYRLRVGYREYRLDFGGSADDAPADDGTDRNLAVTALVGWAF